ncbi:MAG: hypothetical protein WC767_03820 [Candidatus Paceibacterota bacterium]|jgi:hypothetical protein
MSAENIPVGKKSEDDDDDGGSVCGFWERVVRILGFWCLGIMALAGLGWYAAKHWHF